MISDDDYQKTDSFRSLWRDFGLDRDVPLDAQLVTAGDARRFWTIYRGQREILEPATAPQIAAVAEQVLLADQGSQGGLVVLRRYGAAIAVTSECGSMWLLTAARATEADIAAAMVAEAAQSQSPQ